MTYTNPYTQNSVSSKERLHGLEGLVDIGCLGDTTGFDPDEISWATDRLGITDWEGAYNATLNSDYHVITVAPEIDIGANATFNLSPGSGKVREVLTEAARYINRIMVETDDRIVVHCAMGMERAPLTVAWYLMNEKYIGFDDAYEIIARARPIVCDRREWLDW
ncbi:hypothetical protein CMI37_13290 [Candidatus Pacearchaeota archaeon]|nr:hypothetical protein [Candidatus Pacearchaeota archaeon]